MMNLYAWIPLKGRGGYIVIVTYTYDGWIRIESGQNGVLNGHAVSW